MKNLRYTNLWASITAYTNTKVGEFRLEFPDVQVGWIDWESVNVHELPDGDLIGPASMTMMEQESDILSVTFAIGVSSHLADKNLFRHRQMVADIFEDLVPEKKLPFYNENLQLQSSVLIMTGGTLLSPMTKMNVRPWQYIQAEALLVPEGI